MNIIIVVNTANAKAIDAAAMLETYLTSLGIQTATFPAHNAVDMFEAGQCPFACIDMAVALGGDGTILHTACATKTFNAPILGINFGHLGFLANDAEEGVVKIVAAALSGDVTYDKRANIEVDVYDKEGACHTFFALNEINFARGSSGRFVDYRVMVSGDSLYRMSADGLIIATATGSTAYALSAGGPLVSPGYKGFVVVPLAPHSITSRAIMTAPEDVVEVQFGLDESHSEVELFVDGVPESIDAGIDHAVIRKGDTETTLLRYKKESFTSQISRVFFNRIAE